jgi:hypothetical protein
MWTIIYVLVGVLVVLLLLVLLLLTPVVIMARLVNALDYVLRQEVDQPPANQQQDVEAAEADQFLHSPE